MACAQLTYRESLRDIEACLGALGAKLYHMGFHGKVARSALADANESRDCRIFADFAHVLIRIARPLCAADPAETFGAERQSLPNPSIRKAAGCIGNVRLEPVTSRR